jgi:hypothetical protein
MNKGKVKERQLRELVRKQVYVEIAYVHQA